MPADNVKLMVFDVDGVLTDGKLVWQSDGFDAKSFHVKDGLGISLLRKARIEVAFISGRQSSAVDLRAKELGVRFVHQGVDEKVAAIRDVMHRAGVREDETGYMGDDLPDLPLMCACGFSATPSDGHAQLQRYASLTTARGGGRGAVSEACEFILQAQGKLAAAMAPYLPVAGR